MKLELVNFRCHIHQIYNFPEHHISLLKGEPGNGKTTIFNAIWWVLYGHLRGVGHHLTSSGRTKVKIEFEQLVSLGKGVMIQRQNHPNKLILTIQRPVSSPDQGSNYQGEIAQQLINQVFGSRETWKAVSYIIQGEQCLLLSGSKQDRLKLLEELSFHQDDPKEALHKIDQQLTIERDKFKLMELTYQSECQRLNQEIALGAIPVNSCPEQVINLQAELTRLQQNLDQEQQKDRERSKWIGLLGHLKREIQNIQQDPACQSSLEELISKLETQTDQIANLENQLEITQARIAEYDATEGKEIVRLQENLDLAHRQKSVYLTNLNLLQQELTKLNQVQQKVQTELTSAQSGLGLIDKFLSDIQPWITEEETRLSPLPETNWPTLLELGQVTQIETDRKANLQLANQVGIEYTSHISTSLTEIELQLRTLEDQIHKTRRINKIISLRQQSRELQSNLEDKFGLTRINLFPDVVSNQIVLGNQVIQLKKLLQEKENSLALLSCPKCGESLSVENGSLTSHPQRPASPTEIQKLREEISHLTKLSRLLLTLQNSWEDISNLEIDQSDNSIDLNPINQEIQVLTSRLRQLRQIRWIPVPEMDSVRMGALVQLKSKRQEQEMMISKKEAQEQLISLKLVEQTEANQRIEIITHELEKLNQNSIQPINHQIQLLEEQKTNQSLKLSSSPIAQFRSRVSQIKSEIDQTRLKGRQLEEIISRRKILFDQLETKKQQVAEMEVSLKRLGDSHLKQISDQIVTKQKDLTAVQRGIKIINWQQRLTEDREKLINQQGSLADLEELRKVAERVEYKRLRETIDSINTTMNQVFYSLFDDEITVELELFKQLKTQNRTKPQVNCLIHYKGFTYDTPSSISGGEKNRLNLGMILALNLVSSSPLILLDECTCFLNNRLRIQCLETIRQIIGECKTIIAVAHEDNEASYDQVIEVLPDREELDSLLKSPTSKEPEISINLS